MKKNFSEATFYTGLALIAIGGATDVNHFAWGNLLVIAIGAAMVGLVTWATHKKRSRSAHE